MKHAIGKIAEIIDGDRGKNYPKLEEFSENGFCLFLNTGNVTPCGFSFENNQFITQEKDAILRKGKIQRRDIVYTTRGTVGNAAYYGKNVPYEHVRINSGMVILRCYEEKVYPPFLFQILKSESCRTYFKKFCTGSAQPQLPIKILREIELEIPALDAQKRIAATLSAYDDLIENNKKQIKLLEEAAQRLYKEWFVDLRFPGYENVPVVDGVPEGWERCKFSEKVAIMSGGTPSTSNKSFYQGDIPFYTPKDYKGDFFSFETDLHISEEGLNSCNSAYYPTNTIIITARGTVGKTVLLGSPMAMNQSCYALKSDVLNSPYYLFFALRQEVEKLKTMANGGVFDTIIIKTFDSISLMIPLKEILALFERSINAIMDDIKNKQKISKLLTEARDRILPKLMSGELEV